MLRREQHIFHHQPVLVLLYIYIYLTSPCHGRQSILPPCNMGFQTLLMIAHLLHLIFIASPKNVGPSWVAFPRSRTRAQTSMILSSWSTQFAISMNTTSGEDTLVSFNYHQPTEPAYYGVYMYIYIHLCMFKTPQFSQIHETTSGRAQFSGLEAPGRGCLRRGAGAEAHLSLGGWSTRGVNNGWFNGELVGGFKHFLFSIIYGIVLPID